MICVILHICKDAKDNSYSDHRKQVNNVINTLFNGASDDEMAVTQDIFWTEYTDLITRLVYMMRVNLYVKANTSKMFTVIFGIKNIHFLSPRSLVLLHI